MAEQYDAIIIGGGHNGLTCAAYLAKAGRKVLVLERRHILGGAAVSEELYPGFTYSVFSYAVSLLRPEVIRELELAKHGQCTLVGGHAACRTLLRSYPAQILKNIPLAARCRQFAAKFHVTLSRQILRL